MSNVLHATWSVTKVVLARLRFLAVFVAAALVVGYWDDIKNHVDKWTRPPVQLASSDVEYFCTMHPFVVRSEPGICPIAGCGMPLKERKKGQAETLPADVLARVQLTPRRVAMAGIQTSSVEERALVREVRAVGILDYDETRVAQLSSRVPGRADELYVKFVGQAVKRGDPVYAIYSPELYTAQREYLLARQRANEAAKGAEESRHDATEVYNAAMQKLALWGATSEQLDALEMTFDKTGKAPLLFTVTSPISGIVVKKNIYEGAYVSEGTAPYTVADLSKLWLQVQVYEDEAPLVKLGDKVEVRVEGMAHEAFQGTVTFLAYQIDPATRTLAARVEVDNANLTLKPGMFANAMIRVPLIMTATSQPSLQANAADISRAKQFREALEPYFAAQVTLSQDKTEGVSASLHDMLGKLGELKGMPETDEAMGKIQKLVHGTMEQREITELRESFRQISAEMISLGKIIGVPGEGATVKVFHCPMGKQPNWLATGNETINPYMGQKMLNCGAPIETLPARATNGPRRRVESGSRMAAIPRSAVIDTGKQKVVFVANGQMEGVYDMRAVELGPLAGDFYPVLNGLEPGDRVVSQGAFLLDAENRLNPPPAEEAASRPAGQAQR